MLDQATSKRIIKRFLGLKIFNCLNLILFEQYVKRGIDII